MLNMNTRIIVNYMIVDIKLCRDKDPEKFMAAYFRYFLFRLMVIPVTMFIVTAVLYGFIMLTPPEVQIGRAHV